MVWIGIQVLNVETSFLLALLSSSSSILGFGGGCGLFGDLSGVVKGLPAVVFGSFD